MKKIFIIFSLFCFTWLLQGQQLRYVDTGFILEQIPQYQQAKTTLEQQVEGWKQEIMNDQATIDNLQVELENQKVILTDDKIEEKQQEIDRKKKNLQAKIEEKFGVNGASQQLRQNLVKPIQDQIWNAINTIAQKNKIDMVFDKNAGANLIYSNNKYDITELVMKELGLNKAK